MRVSSGSDGCPERPLLPPQHPSEARGMCVQMVTTGLWTCTELAGPCPRLETSLPQISLKQTPPDSSAKVRRGGVVKGGREGLRAKAPAESPCYHLFPCLWDFRQIPPSLCLGFLICKCRQTGKALGSIHAGVSLLSWGKPWAWNRG